MIWEERYRGGGGRKGGGRGGRGGQYDRYRSKKMYMTVCHYVCNSL